MFDMPAIRHLIDCIDLPSLPKSTMLREYLDQQAYAQLLTENSRLDFIAKTYGPKLEAKWLASKSGEPAAVQQGVATSPGETEIEKLIYFFTTIDPTANKELTQWLIIRYLNGRFILEDAMTARDEVLPDFLTMRRNLPSEQRDINRYQSLGDIRAVLRSQQEQDIPAADPVLDAAMHQQAEVIYNGPDVKIVVPKTPEASCYFGKGTDWCTAKYGPRDQHGFFNSYSSRGPLYIIYDKKTRKRVQLHFQSEQFMDEQDRQIDLRQYVEQHPAVVEAIGEDKFLSVAATIGLHWFRPELVAQIPMKRLVYMIHRRQDLKRVPLAIQTSEDFVDQLLRAKPEAITWLPREAYVDHLDTLVRLRGVFKNLPPELQTAELADISAAYSIGWKAILENIPEQWLTPEIYQRVWANRIQNDNALHIQDVPDQFRNKSVIIDALARFPDDIPQNLRYLDRDIVYAIAQKKTEAIAELPEEYLDAHLATLVEQQVTRNMRSHTDKNWAKQPYRILLRFPSEFWHENATKFLVKDHSSFPYTRIPEQFRTPEITEAYLAHHQKDAGTIPHEYLTPDVLSKSLVKDYHGVELLQRLDPSLFPDAMFAKVVDHFKVEGRGYSHLPSNWYEKIPAEMRRPEVRRMFMRLDAVPITEMVPSDMTEDGLIRRAGDHNAEIANIPQPYWTPEFALKLQQRSYHAVKFIPDDMLSEPLLWQVLDPERQHIPPKSEDTYGRGPNDLRDNAGKQIARFPPNLWSSRTYAAAIDHAFKPAAVDDVPPQLLDDAVAGVILKRNPAELPNLPPDLVNDVSLSTGVKNLELLKQLSPEQKTEPVAYAAMKQWASTLQKTRHWHSYKYQEDVAQQLKNFPPSVWSERVYEEAVGYFLTLKDVPSKYRNVAMVKAAIQRDPSNARFLRDPAKFLNKHVSMDGKSQEWLEKLEDNGVIPSSKKQTYSNISELTKHDLPSGYKVAILPMGRVNQRLYLFDPRGKYLCYLYTMKQKVFFPDAKKFVTYAEPLAEMARQYLHVNDAHQLNDAGVYMHYNGRWHTEKTAERRPTGALEWSNMSHLDGSIHIAWFKNKPLLRFYAETSRPAFGNSGNSYVRDDTIYNMPLALAHVLDIMTYLKRHGYDGSYHWQKLGIVNTNARGDGEAVNVGSQDIGKVGEYSAKRGGKFIGIFGPDGMIAYGILRKGTGNIDDIKYTDHYDHTQAAQPAVMQRAFDSIANFLRSKATGKMKLPEH